MSVTAALRASGTEPVTSAVKAITLSGKSAPQIPGPSIGLTRLIYLSSVTTPDFKQATSACFRHAGRSARRKLAQPDKATVVMVQQIKRLRMRFIIVHDESSIQDNNILRHVVNRCGVKVRVKKKLNYQKYLINLHHKLLYRLWRLQFRPCCSRFLLQQLLYSLLLN